jgi:hypothetical protein
MCPQPDWGIVVLRWRMAATGFRLSGITIDCLDPRLVARFWAGLLGGEPRTSLPGWYELGKRAGPRINFQPVLQPKTVKTRIHLDLTVDDIDRAVDLVVQAGGHATGERHDYAEGIVVVMADPEGNEFCLVKYFT